VIIMVLWYVQGDKYTSEYDMMHQLQLRTSRR
jgi:hypothetical protein